jgi:hypothetical protein
MTPAARAALIAAVAAICEASMLYDAAPHPIPRRTYRCDRCGRTRIGCKVTMCKRCGGWMRQEQEK